MLGGADELADIRTPQIKLDAAAAAMDMKLMSDSSAIMHEIRDSAFPPSRPEKRRGA
jgi:hypothetical protein